MKTGNQMSQVMRKPVFRNVPTGKTRTSQLCYRNFGHNIYKHNTLSMKKRIKTFIPLHGCAAWADLHLSKCCCHDINRFCHDVAQITFEQKRRLHCQFLWKRESVYQERTFFFMKAQKFSWEPPHDKTNKMTVRQAKTQISLGIRPVWSVFTVHSVGS